MSKLSRRNKFLDLSDYGRWPAHKFAKLLLKTPFTAIHVTFLFLIVGIAAIYFMLINQLLLAGVFLILKSIIDAADGELARLKNKPSYIGRYLDSVFDLLLNFAFLYTIYYLTNGELWMMLIAFVAIQLQGTVFNYYYTILRSNSTGGDTTSRVEENSFPTALHGENQKTVNFLFIIYTLFYGVFDKTIFLLDPKAKEIVAYPKWFMTLTTIYGLGFQLLIMSILLAFNLTSYIIPFFIYYSVFILLIIGIRKIYIHNH